MTDRSIHPTPGRPRRLPSSRWGAAAACAAGLAGVLSPSATAATRTVTMGQPVKSQKAFAAQDAEVLDFFPHRTTIKVGGTVAFVPAGFHNVDLPGKGEAPSSFAVPTGKAAATDAAGAAFWFNGQDALGLNPALFASGFGKTVEYSGATRVGSGLPLADKPEPARVTFTRAGRFTYYCDLHPGMKGVVRVLPRGGKAPTARQHARAARRQVERDLAVAKRLKRYKAPAGSVDVGGAGRYGVERFAFFPRTRTVDAGTTLTFRMSPRSFEVHTATAGPGDPVKEPTSYLGKLAASFTSPVLDPIAVYPSDPPASTATLTPATHGNGFWNSGVMDRSARTPQVAESRVTFGQPGTYRLHCLIHPDMHGKVVVR